MALVVLFGFAVLGWLAYRTYTAEPPIPGRVVTPAGDVLLTGDDITRGQQVFLRNGLMQYGLIFGHGAYVGPDFTADYLHRASEIALREYGGTGSDTARQQVIEDFETNRYDAPSNTLTYTDAQATAFEELIEHYRDYFGAPTTDTILAWGMNDEPLPDMYGAPLRLRVESMNGYKMVKWVRSVSWIRDYAEVGDGMGGTREDSGYQDINARI